MSRWSDSSRARTERWKREDDSPRLKDVIPSITRLRIELTEYADNRSVTDSQRVQHYVVERAAAHFEIPCSDARCEDGGHDLTSVVMSALRASRHTFEDEDPCRGYVGEHACGRTLKFTGYVEFGKQGEFESQG